MRLTHVTLGLPLVFLFGAAVSCEPGGILDDDDSALPDDDDSALPDDDDDDAVGDPCDGNRLLIEFEVSFPATAGCDWGEGGNDEQTSGETAARTEQSVSIDIPDGAIVCGLNFDFAGLEDGEQEMFFDDHFLFAFNGAVLAASYGEMVGELDEIGGAAQYDWDDLKGFEIEDDEPDAFCLGDSDGSECEIPPAGEQGEFALSFDGDVVDQLLAEAIEAGQYEFQFVVTGDNNPGDCTHRGFEVTMGASLVAE